ncbi:blood group Rh(CE) polypeptide isoform X2 [Trichosurus vulpecula]|uniref:blood group Rh(CE) polypeptide isoform X2 n=1 Tax=Trichosurus vulpecula TaxID=9337 RepID=UPI00186B32D4|nr:blood group Rh(CE) polypeptide isoform X2 [Trichosurus vulpecula]
MGSKYPKSLRIFLPFWALILETAFILIFYFFTSYEIRSKKLELLETYSAFQDINVMAVLGLGFLKASLRRYAWSSVAFNLFTLALGVQWAIILDGFLFSYSGEKITINIQRIIRGTMSAMSVLISSGATLGKVNLVQLIVMTLLEVTVFQGTKFSLTFLKQNDHQSMMQIHMFAAYFGVATAWCLSGPGPDAAKEKEQRATTSTLFTTLGTLFLWIFWPTFNSALLDYPSEKETAVSNTYYALAVSAVVAMSFSAASHSEGKISMNHVYRAMLAGGVAVGVATNLIYSPWIAMVLGFLAAMISIIGAKCLPGCLNRIIGLHDTCEVHSTFGLPGLLGGLTYIVLIAEQANWTKVSTAGFQILLSAGCVALTMATGLAGGVLTGSILRLNLWKAPHAAKYFDDQAFWKFPHLAVGF